MKLCEILTLCEDPSWWPVELSRALRQRSVMETRAQALPTVLYHGTSSKHLHSILTVGLWAPTHWGSLDVAKFFARQECTDPEQDGYGGRPVIIRMAMSQFHPDGFRVDQNMIDFFPVLIQIRGADWNVLNEQWKASDQTWQDCLRIYESVIYDAPVAVSHDDIIR